MSDQLTLADVEAGQYIKILETGSQCWIRVDGNHCLARAWFLVEMDAESANSPQSCEDRLVPEHVAKKMKVELMELVPADRDSELQQFYKFCLRHKISYEVMYGEWLTELSSGDCKEYLANPKDVRFGSRNALKAVHDFWNKVQEGEAE